MEKPDNLSDLITLAQNSSPVSEENRPLFDLYRTLKEGLKDKDHYQGIGLFKNTNLRFFEKDTFVPIALPPAELDLSQLEKHNGELLLEVKTSFDFKYPSTQRKETETRRGYLTIEEGEVYLDGEKLEETSVKNAL